MSYIKRKQIIHLEDDLEELRRLKLADKLTVQQYVKAKTAVMKRIEIVRKDMEESDDKKNNQ